LGPHTTSFGAPHHLVWGPTPPRLGPHTTSFGAPHHLVSSRYRVFCRRVKRPGHLKVTINYHLVSRLKTNGAVPPLSLWVFKKWTWKIPRLSFFTISLDISPTKPRQYQSISQKPVAPITWKYPFHTYFFVGDCNIARNSWAKCLKYSEIFGSTRIRARSSEIRFPPEAKIFFLSTIFTPSLRPTFTAYRRSVPEKNQREREGNHWFPSGAKVKNEWS